MSDLLPIKVSSTSTGIFCLLNPLMAIQLYLLGCILILILLLAQMVVILAFGPYPRRFLPLPTANEVMLSPFITHENKIHVVSNKTDVEAI